MPIACCVVRLCVYVRWAGGGAEGLAGWEGEWVWEWEGFAVVADRRVGSVEVGRESGRVCQVGGGG
jgi:hypothetical protein